MRDKKCEIENLQCSTSKKKYRNDLFQAKKNKGRKKQKE